jgi:hypothetical protein
VVNFSLLGAPRLLLIALALHAWRYDREVMRKLVLVVTCVLVAGRVSAQSVYVQGAVTREIKRFSGQPSEPVFDGTASGVAIGVAEFAAPHWTVGLEIDLGGQSTVRRSSTVTVSGRPTTIDTDYAIERRSAAAIAGYQQEWRHVRLGYYAGWSFSYFRREISSNAPAIVLTEPAAPTIFTDRVGGVVVGVDVAIDIMPHVAVVPSFRAQAVTLTGELAGHSYRPSVGARITF